MKTQTIDYSTTLKFWLVLLILIVLSFAQAIGNSPGELPEMKNSFIETFENSDELYRTETFRVDGPVQLEVSTSGGHINIEKGNSEEVEIKLFVRSGSSFWGGSEFDPDDFTIEFKQTGNNISATVEHKRQSRSWFGSQPSFTFEIKVPGETTTDLSTSGGHIDVSGLTGNQKMRTSGGHITLKSLEGNIESRTSGGHIRVSSFKGILNSQTSGGHITLEDVSGELTVRTSGGHIKAENVVGSLDARTSGGNIDCNVLDITDALVLRTSGGRIRATIPAGKGYDLNLRGSSVNVSDLNNFSGDSQRNRVIGKIGDGSTAIQLRTSGGSVNLSFN